MASKDKDKEKTQTPWDVFVSTLTPSARNAVLGLNQNPLAPKAKEQPLDDDGFAFASFRNTLSPAAAAAIAELASGGHEDAVIPDESQVRYSLMEIPDGDWSRVSLFKTPEGLAKRIGELEGEDVSVWPFIGVNLKITRGPQRYLILQDGETALSIPMFAGGPVKPIAANLVDTLEIQEDGFLGPVALSGSLPALTKAKGHKAAKKAEPK